VRQVRALLLPQFVSAQKWEHKRMNAPGNQHTVASNFGDNATLRWSCRAGDFVLWIGTDSVFNANRASSWSVRDFWQMRDGDYLTITNRWADLPGWFELHPLEVAGRAVWEMQKRLDAGHKPKEILDGPNLWRVKAGERLVWVTIADSANPVKGMLNMRACALVLGENANPTSSEIFFGAPDGNELPPSAAAAMRAGFDAAVALGVPRTFAPEWSFGA
jgi:hypothetical protein